MYSTEDRRVHNLEHARWRVKVQQALLEAHRTLSHHSEEWARKDAEYLQSLKEAKAELYRQEHWPHAFPSSQGTKGHLGPVTEDRGSNHSHESRHSP
jgi:hypothetical protein